MFADKPDRFSYFWSQVAKNGTESTNERQGPRPSLCPGLGAALRFWAGPPKLKVWGGAIKSAQLARAGARRRQLPRAWRARRARRVAKFGPQGPPRFEPTPGGIQLEPWNPPLPRCTVKASRYECVWGVMFTGILIPGLW